MLQFRNVLCPIDFSAISAGALTYAVTLARWYDAHLEVLHVAPALDEPGVPPDAGGGEQASPARDRVIAAVQRVAGAAGAPDLRFTALALTGRADEMIASRARALPADLLVMGTHGRSGFNRLLLGSVTEKVLRQVTCPVLTVPPAAPDRPAPPTFKVIVCALDSSPSAVKALHYALDLGRQAGGRVIVVHALEYTDPEEMPEPSPFDPCHEVMADSRRRRQSWIDRARQRLQAQLAEEPTTWCEIEPIVAIDRAYKAILRHAGDAKADLIVMGAQGAGGLELMVYGSNTQHVLRAAACPVLTVRA